MLSDDALHARHTLQFSLITAVSSCPKSDHTLQGPQQVHLCSNHHIVCEGLRVLCKLTTSLTNRAMFKTDTCTIRTCRCMTMIKALCNCDRCCATPSQAAAAFALQKTNINLYHPPRVCKLHSAAASPTASGLSDLLTVFTQSACSEEATVLVALLNHA